jgi:hypothetical protein
MAPCHASGLIPPDLAVDRPSRILIGVRNRRHGFRVAARLA